MTINIKQILLCIFLVSGATACTENLNYSYLMQHPFELKKAYERCQSETNRYETNSNCDVVFKAAQDFYEILSTQQADPEKFGQLVLDSQIACVKLKAEVQQKEQTLKTLETKKATPDAIKLAQYNLEDATEQYKNALEKVKMMLSVIGVNTPE